MSHYKLTFGALVALVSFTAFPLLGAEDSRFSIAIGSHEDLLISGPGGEKIADVAGQAVGQNVTVGNNSFQVSYGRDANGQLTAILASPKVEAVALHFTVGGKNIDAEKAVVTLTFSPDHQGVLVDPGYVGTVEVDSHILRARSLADDLPMPAAVANAPSDVVMPNLAPASATASILPAQPTTSEVNAPAPSMPEPFSTPAPSPDASVAETSPQPTPSAEPSSTPVPAPAPGSTSLASAAATPESAPSTVGDLPSAPVPLARQISPILAPLSGAASTRSTTGTYVSVLDRMNGSLVAGKPGQSMQEKLYWSEPVTAPDGSAPAVAPDQIRLVEVHGTVTITAPGSAPQTGTEGMLVPSGATVQTADNSSAALFMGGVNSARLMPNCNLVVTQALSGTVRKDVINLQGGAVFSRIGHRDGETESYSISTPEGTTAAETNDMLAFRGTPDDLRAHSVTSARLNFGLSTLLAWNPAASRGLISDVPVSDMGNIDGGHKDAPATYFYYCQSSGPVQSTDVRHEVLTNDGQYNDQGGDHHQDCQPQYVLQQILETLQPYNTKLKQVIANIDCGTGSPAEVAFYHTLIGVYFCIQEPGIVNVFENDPRKFDKRLNAYNSVLAQDLNEFGLPSLTPH